MKRIIVLVLAVCGLLFAGCKNLSMFTECLKKVSEHVHLTPEGQVACQCGKYDYLIGLAENGAILYVDTKDSNFTLAKMRVGDTLRYPYYTRAEHLVPTNQYFVPIKWGWYADINGNHVSDTVKVRSFFKYWF